MPFIINAVAAPARAEIIEIMARAILGGSRGHRKNVAGAIKNMSSALQPMPMRVRCEVERRRRDSSQRNTVKRSMIEKVARV